MPERGDVIRSHDGCVVHAAAKNNLDDITQIHIAGFTEEPDVHYRYPLRHQYPEDHWKWTRKEYESYLEQPQKFVLHVVEAPSEADGRVFMKPFGLAVWDIAVTSKANATGTLKSPHYLRLDLSLTNALSQMSALRKEEMQTKSTAKHSEKRLGNAGIGTFQSMVRIRYICLSL